MREILFRGKRLSGDWVYGYLLKMFGELSIMCLDDENNIYPVNERTIGQYTGLTDKNGKKIFDKDIVRDCDGRIYEIKHFDFEWIAEQTSAFWINIKHLKPCEIIANIYDNYELLEKKNDKN